MNYTLFVLFVVLSFNVSCGGGLLGPTKEILKEQYNNKLEDLREKTRENLAGWPSDHDCDAALWAGIARAAGADWVQVSAALDSHGRPMRRPYSDCSTPDESRTTTSNDMMTGIILGLVEEQNVSALKSFWDYGYTRGWVMGYPEWFLARVYLRPNGVSLLARALHQFSNGTISYPMRFSPVLYGPTDADYATHLILLSRLIQRKVGGPSYGMDIAEQIVAARHSTDALAQALAGNSILAAKLLMNDYKAPSYVRGHENYELVHWLLAARVTLDNKSWLDKSPIDMVR
jgi:hypothetical protein